MCVITRVVSVGEADVTTEADLDADGVFATHWHFHYGRTDQCVNCHREHRPSTVTCEKCHDIEPWKMKAPR